MSRALLSIHGHCRAIKMLLPSDCSPPQAVAISQRAWWKTEAPKNNDTEKSCSQVNASTIDGVSPLFNACTVGSVACAEILLENGAKPQSLVYCPSPIHEATSKGIFTTKYCAHVTKHIVFPLTF